MDSVKFTAVLSLVLQLVTGLIEAFGLRFKVRPEDLIVKDILAMELIVQCVEFVFYLYLVYLLFSSKVDRTVTSHRYFDWFITTPVMLIGFVTLFKYLKDPHRNIRLFESIQEEYDTILKILTANTAMLGFGVASELYIIDKNIGVVIGFLPFLYMFQILYSKYAKFTSFSLGIFYAMFLIWGSYGIAALLPFASKNSMYNILDLFSKNIYGLFLFGMLYSKQSKA